MAFAEPMPQLPTRQPLVCEQSVVALMTVSDSSIDELQHQPDSGDQLDYVDRYQAVENRHYNYYNHTRRLPIGCT